jgi:uncharacterized membrane protein
VTVFELSKARGFRSLAMPDPDREITGVYVGDLLSWVMGRANEGDLWLTIMTNANVLAVATLAGVAAVLLCEDCEPDAELIALANEKHINLLVTDKRIYEACLNVGALLK